MLKIYCLFWGKIQNLGGECFLSGPLDLKAVVSKDVLCGITLAVCTTCKYDPKPQVIIKDLVTP